jgi:hypothetical protein
MGASMDASGGEDGTKFHLGINLRDHDYNYYKTRRHENITSKALGVHVGDRACQQSKLEIRIGSIPSEHV